MKFAITFLFLSALLVFAYCKHTFMGTNVQRPMIFHLKAQYNAKVFQKRVENIQYTLPQLPDNYGRAIQGILAYDLTNSEATANVTVGGLGKQTVNIRLKSERGKKLDYDIYIYA